MDTIATVDCFPDALTAGLDPFGDATQVDGLAGGGCVVMWRHDAACAAADAEWWFAFDGTAEDARAKEICARCPVRGSCLAEALTAGQDDGVWGGLNASERRRLRREAVVPT